VLSGEATNANFIVFGSTRSGSNPRSTALEANTLSITMRFSLVCNHTSDRTDETELLLKVTSNTFILLILKIQFQLDNKY